MEMSASPIVMVREGGPSTSSLPAQSEDVDGGPSPAMTMMVQGEPSSSLLLVDLFPRVLDHRHRLELDVGEPAVHLLGLAHVFVLHDVARVGVDHDRAARARVVLPALQQLHR